MFRLKQRTTRRRERGIVTVETALVLPVVIYLTFAVIEYSWLFLKYQQITNASRQGARAGAVPDGTDATVSAQVATVMSDAGIATYSISTSPSSTGLATGSTFSVTVSVNYADVELVGMPLIPTPGTLSAETAMAKEGP